ncbi:MAG: hypothetical protein Q9159_005875 [Coniocarpon cinnabarinum]
MPVDFGNFDDSHVYTQALGRARSADARNFVLDFSHEKARCAFDIDEGDLRQLLGEKHLAATYGFSPRLRGLMKSKHCINSQRRSKTHKPPTNKAPSHASGDVELETFDIEKHTAQTQTIEYDLMKDLTHYDVVRSIYHYTSVDPGVKCADSHVAI